MGGRLARTGRRRGGWWTLARLCALIGCTERGGPAEPDSGQVPATDSVDDSDERAVISCAEAAQEFATRVREAAGARSHCTTDAQCVVRHASYACALDTKVRECGIALAVQHTTGFVHTVSAIAAEICTRVEEECAVEVCEAEEARCEDGVCVIVPEGEGGR